MANRDFEEMSAADIPIQEGYLGNLTDDQHNALVRMWESYFDICDRARGNASKGKGFVESKEGKDPKKSGIPDSDEAKDEAKRQQEQEGMNELMETYGSEALRDSFWQFARGDSPDGGMLRFVRARKGDVGRGLAMMATCLKWRLDTDVESFILKGDLGNGKEIPKFIEQQKSGKVFSLGCTSKEQPICYVIMKYHSVFGQPAASMQKFIVTQMETFRLLMHPPADKATIFFDLKGFGLKQMDFVSLIYLVKVLESYYPESLGTMYVSNAPLIFWGFWRAVKNLLDPVVRNKIKFIATPADTEGDVPEDMMIEYCGGTVTNEFKFVDAREGENDVQNDTETKDRLLKRHRGLTDKFEDVTRQWCKTGGKDEELQEQRDVLCKKIRLSQFELEPYTRGLTVYHRNGVLPPENAGISVFDYEVKGGPTRRQVLGRRTCRKTLEQELYRIVTQGQHSKDAEDETAENIRNGSWGQWRVNDNSDKIKKVALASLDDPDNSGKLKTEKVDAQGSTTVAVQQAPDEVVQEYRQAAEQEQPQAQQQQEPQSNGDNQQHDRRNGGAIAAAAGAGAAGGAAIASRQASSPPKQNGYSAQNDTGRYSGQNGSGRYSAQNDDGRYSSQNGSGRYPAQNDTGRYSAQNGAGRNTAQNRGPSRSNAPYLDPNYAINAARPRGNSARSGPSSSGPTNYAKEEKPSSAPKERRRSSLFGSIKSKIPGMA